MSKSRELFLTALDIYSTENLAIDKLVLQHQLEHEPFAVLSERNGHTVLSVGDFLDTRRGITVEVPN